MRLFRDYGPRNRCLKKTESQHVLSTYSIVIGISSLCQADTTPPLFHQQKLSEPRTALETSCNTSEYGRLPSAAGFGGLVNVSQNDHPEYE